MHMWCKATTYENGIECSETSAHKIQTPGNHPKEEKIQNSEYGGSFKSLINLFNTAKPLQISQVTFFDSFRNAVTLRPSKHSAVTNFENLVPKF